MCVIVDCICVETLWLAAQFLQIERKYQNLEENNRITILLKHFANCSDVLLSITKILLR